MERVVLATFHAVSTRDDEAVTWSGLPSLRSTSLNWRAVVNVSSRSASPTVWMLAVAPDLDSPSEQACVCDFTPPCQALTAP